MPKQAKQSTVYDFQVVQKQLSCDGVPIPFYGNMRTDTKAVLGVTSEKYGIIQNNDLIQMARDTFDSLKLGAFEESIIIAGEGERMYATFTFKHKQLASAVGDVFGVKFTVQNSHDRKLRAAVNLGFLRLACLNGMATLEKEFGLTKKHSQNVTIDFMRKAIESAMERSQSALGVFDDMAQRPVNNLQGINVLKQLVIGKVLSAKIADEAQNLWLNPSRKEDKPRTLYSVYNAITEHLTRKVAPESFEYANRTSGNVLLAMVNAVKDAAKFTLLIAPPPIDTTVTVTVAPAATPATP